MKRQLFSLFVERPRTIGDLIQPHLPEQEEQFEIVRTVTLSRMDYENFITDLLADRQYLEDFPISLQNPGVRKCILIRQRGSEDGVLVQPRGCFVAWAAYYAASHTIP